MTPTDRAARRALERELRELPTPPPPAGLLDALRAEIPGELASNDDPHAGRGRGAGRGPIRRWHRHPLARLAASLAVVGLGVALAGRVGREPAPPAGTTASESGPRRVVTETAPLDAAFDAAEPVDDSRSAGEQTTNGGNERDPRGSERQRQKSAEKGKDKNSVQRDAAVSPVAPDARGRSGSTPSTESLSSSVPFSAAPSPSPDSLTAQEATSVPAPAKGARIDSADAGQQEISQALPPAVAARAKAEVEEELRALGYLGEARPGSRAGASSVVAEREEVAGRDESVAETITVAGESAGIDISSSTTETRIVPGVPESRRSREARRVESAPIAPPTPSRAPTAPDTMIFRPVEPNPFVDTVEDRLSTFALDVDTGSWTLARAYLERGVLPPPGAIRVEELVNAQRYDDPAPRRGDFTLVAEGAPTPFAPRAAAEPRSETEYRLLRFAVRGRDVAPAERRPAVLTFVVDVSGSMARENRLGLVKRALGLLLDELDAGDRVGLVVYGTRGRVVLRPTRDLEAIRAAVAELRPEGSTNAEEGLVLGYEVASEAFREGAANRVVLCSDGVANVGVTGPEAILERIGREARRGIELTSVGVGMGNYNDELMERLADRGDGRYHYVDTLEEARRIFVEELTGTLETVARDAKVQVNFEPGAVARWRLVGYENREVADRDFRDDRVDAGEIGAGHQAVALYEVRLDPEAARTDRLATLRLRWRSVASGSVEEAALELRVRDLESSFEEASTDLRRAAIAAELGERLAASSHARDGSWHALRREAERLAADAGAGDRELATLVRLAVEISDEPIAEEVDRGEELHR
jgi:Ca-activated chloride channel family protein